MLYGPRTYSTELTIITSSEAILHKISRIPLSVSRNCTSSSMLLATERFTEEPCEHEGNTLPDEFATSSNPLQSAMVKSRPFPVCCSLLLIVLQQIHHISAPWSQVVLIHIHHKRATPKSITPEESRIVKASKWSKHDEFKPMRVKTLDRIHLAFSKGGLRTCVRNHS